MVFDFVAFILLVFYSGLLLLEVKQITDVFWSKNKILNYRNSIIVILAMSAFLRVIFWSKVLSPTAANESLMMTIFYLPVWLNFAALSLLSLFFANAIYKGKYGNWPWIICLIVNVIFGALNITIGILVGKHSIIHNFYIAYAVFLDAFTAIVVGYFGYRFVYSGLNQRNWILPRPIEEFAFVNWVIVGCFLLRSVMVALLSTNLITKKSSSEVQFSGSHSPTSLTLLFFFIITEWIPSSAILYLLWKPRYSTEKSKSNYMDDSSSEVFCTVTENDLRDNLLTRQTSIEDSIIKVIFNTEDDDGEDFLEEEEDCFEERDFSFSRSSDNPWAVNNTVVGALYRTPSPQVANLKAIDFSESSVVGGSNNTDTEMQLRGDSFRRSYHLDPNAIYTTINNEDQCYLDEMYSDTLGPRDILNSGNIL